MVFQHYKYESETYANGPSGPTSAIILFVHLILWILMLKVTYNGSCESCTVILMLWTLWHESQQVRTVVHFIQTWECDFYYRPKWPDCGHIICTLYLMWFLCLWILCSCGSYVQDPEVHQVRTCSPLMQTKWKVCKNKDALGRVILLLATTSHWHWLDTVWRWLFITSAQTEVATHNQEEQSEHVL